MYAIDSLSTTGRICNIVDLFVGLDDASHFVHSEDYEEFVDHGGILYLMISHKHEFTNELM